MEKRRFENINEEVSLLGFGCMRFPMDENGKINEAEAEEMLDYAIAKGVNYIDTAYPYHNGDSEPFVGRALKKYPRASFKLATKLPIWKVETLDDVVKLFDEQFERLQIEYVDFYLLHALNKERFDKIVALKIIPLLEEYQRKGRIKHLGFSFHDEYEVFEEIATYRKWDFCQIQYNYIDTLLQAGEKGITLCDKLNIPLVIMEPIKGGKLAMLPSDIKQIFTNYNPEASIASWALRFVGSNNSVKCILSGMSTLEQVVDNVNVFDNFKALNAVEHDLVKQVADTINARTKNGCTGCAYCMPCPFGVDIPTNFALWNEESVYGNDLKTIESYQNLSDEAKATNCQACGKCEIECPQKIQIRDDLKRVVLDLNK